MCVCACAQECLCVASAVLHKAPSKKQRVVGSRTQSLLNRPFSAELTLSYWAFCHAQKRARTHAHADGLTASSDNETAVNHSKPYKNSWNQIQTWKENYFVHIDVTHYNTQTEAIFVHVWPCTLTNKAVVFKNDVTFGLIVRVPSSLCLERLCTRVSGKWVVLIHCGSVRDDFVTPSSAALSPLTFGLNKGFGRSAVIHTLLMLFFSLTNTEIKYIQWFSNHFFISLSFPIMLSFVSLVLPGDSSPKVRNELSKALKLRDVEEAEKQRGSERLPSVWGIWYTGDWLRG